MSETKHSKPNRPSLVVSIDIGTTFSAVALCIQTPGSKSKPPVELITRWPKQTDPSARLPSVLCYDDHGVLKAVGAECDDTDLFSEGEKWHRIQWWKLCFRPDHLPLVPDLQDNLPVIPPELGLTVDDILVDFLRYIGQGIQQHLEDTHGDVGLMLWQELKPGLTLIMTAPNGWEGHTHHRMRRGAIKAGLVQHEKQVKFVHEAEATILYTADSGRLNEWLQKGEYIAVCDCGGGTVDITPYKVIQHHPLKLEEVSYPRCYLAGSVFINRRAEVWLRQHLEHTEYPVTPRILESFEKEAKRSFDETKRCAWVTLWPRGSRPDEHLRIIVGRLQITKETMANFFRPSIDAILGGLDEVTNRLRGRVITKVILAGGFANSQYLYNRVRRWADTKGISLARPNDPLEKAVASGGILYHLSPSVVSRVAKFHYGIDGSLPYNPHDSLMKGRKIFIDGAGKRKVGSAFTIVVKKGAHIRTNEACHSWVHAFLTDDDNLDTSFDLYAFRWSDPPKFIRGPGSRADHCDEGFFRVCEFNADLTELYEATEYETNAKGKKFKRLQYQVSIFLGDTQVQARLRWYHPENNKYIESEVAIGYD